MSILLYAGQNCSGSDTDIPVIQSVVKCDNMTSNLLRVSYKCSIRDEKLVIWGGSFFRNEVTVTNTAKPEIRLNISGLSVEENHILDNTCFQSTLTFTGINIAKLHNLTLSCRTATVASIAVLIPPRELFKQGCVSNLYH